MCVLCDGGSEEDLLADEFVRIAIDGFVMIGVEGTPTWGYTIGLLQSFGHPELVVTGRPSSAQAHLIAHAVGRIKEGERFDVSSPPVELCDCGPLTFGPVHDAQWEQGRFDWWLRYYAWAGGEPPSRQALQLLWSDAEGRFPPHPDFCCGLPRQCQPLLDGIPRHNVNGGPSREERRRHKYGRGKGRRP